MPIQLLDPEVSTAPTKGVAHLTGLVEEKISHVHSLVEIYQGHRARTKQWCLTIWVAAAFGIGTGTVHVAVEIAALLLFGPVMMFWLIEAMYDAAIHMFYLHYKDLALRLLLDKREGTTTSDRDLVGPSYRRMGNRDKAAALLGSLFVTKTIVGFYLPLLALSLALLIMSS